MDLENQLKIIVRDAIIKESTRFDICPKLAASIAYQESFRATQNFTESVWAIRYEDGFYARYLANKNLVGENPNYNKVSRVTERRARAFSYGLFQIMGQTAREMGFSAPYLAALCWPPDNVHYGIKYLAGRIKRFGRETGIRAYNGAIDNPATDEYLKKIEDHLLKKQYLKILGE